MKKIKDSLKYIKKEDLLAPFILLIVIIPSLFFRLINKFRRKKLWLVCEDGHTARDNGYHFYKYIRENHSEDYCYYVIDKKSYDYAKVKKYGNIIQFKSLKHWIYYLAANYNISSQKNGNPNQPLFYVIHVALGLFNNRVFLQHGIIKDLCEWLLYKNTKFKYFICGAKKEYDYVKDNYGYPDRSVIYTGLSRFDNLHNYKTNSNQILIMPTWRNWLGRETNAFSVDTNFTETNYYKHWSTLLNSKKFIEYIEKNNYKVYFYPHINMQKYLNYFKSNSNNIYIVDTTTDIQEIMKKSHILVTDYSSVFMDFAYMLKPIIYFQFDKEEFRSKQYIEGYFSYEKDGFGPVVENANAVIENIIKYMQNDIEKKYIDKMNAFFKKRDSKNSERIYQVLKGGECK